MVAWIIIWCIVWFTKWKKQWHENAAKVFADAFNDMLATDNDDSNIEMSVHSINNIPFLALQYTDDDGDTHIFVEDTTVGDIVRLFNITQESFFEKLSQELEASDCSSQCCKQDCPSKSKKAPAKKATKKGAKKNK